MNLGLIYLGMGQYDKAIEAFGAVRRKSRQWAAGAEPAGRGPLGQEPRPGTAGRRRGCPVRSPEGDRHAERRLEGPPRSRRRARRPRLWSATSATWRSSSPRPASRRNALALLDPVIKAQTVKSGPGYARLIEAQLKAYIASGKVEPAIASMKALEQAGGAAGRAQLYFKLGKLLEKELDRLREKGNTTALATMHQAYKTFLTTLVESKTGQTYESLEWAGEGLLTLDAYQDAEKVFRRVLTEFTQDPKFLQQPGGPARLLRTRLKLAAALRGQKKFDEADILIDDLLKDKQTKRYIDPAVREGYAAGGPSRGRQRHLVGGPGILGKPRQEAGSGTAAVRLLLRRLVSRGLGPLQAKVRDEGAPDAPGRDAALAERRRSRNEGEISRFARTNQMTC